MIPNATLIVQAVVFALLIWFCIRFIWPPLVNAIETRQKQIADGLAEAERGRSSLADAHKQTEQLLKDARERAHELLAQAEKAAHQRVEESKAQAKAEADRIAASAKAQLLSLIHISEPTRLALISYAVFCLKKIFF